jgi:hypothetical protein
MLHARNENINDQFLGNAALPLVDQDAASFLKSSDVSEAVIESRMGPIDEDGDTGKDSGNESAEADSDSEDKKESMKAIQNERKSIFFKCFRQVFDGLRSSCELENL